MGAFAIAYVLAQYHLHCHGRNLSQVKIVRYGGETRFSSWVIVRRERALEMGIAGLGSDGKPLPFRGKCLRQGGIPQTDDALAALKNSNLAE